MPARKDSENLLVYMPRPARHVEAAQQLQFNWIIASSKIYSIICYTLSQSCWVSKRTNSSVTINISSFFLQRRRCTLVLASHHRPKSICAIKHDVECLLASTCNLTLGMRVRHIWPTILVVLNIREKWVCVCVRVYIWCNMFDTKATLWARHNCYTRRVRFCLWKWLFVSQVWHVSIYKLRCSFFSWQNQNSNWKSSSKKSSNAVIYIFEYLFYSCESRNCYCTLACHSRVIYNPTREATKLTTSLQHEKAPLNSLFWKITHDYCASKLTFLPSMGFPASAVTMSMLTPDVFRTFPQHRKRHTLLTMPTSTTSANVFQRALKHLASCVTVLSRYISHINDT